MCSILAFSVEYPTKQWGVSLCFAHNNTSSEICGTSNQIPHSTHAGGQCQISQFVFNTSPFSHIAVLDACDVQHDHHSSDCGTPGVFLESDHFSVPVVYSARDVSFGQRDV